MIGDKFLLERFHTLFQEGNPYYKSIPFDVSVKKSIDELLKVVNYGGEGDELYRHLSVYQDLWIDAIKASIVSLRKQDKREHRTPDDTPSAYGVEDLMKYFKDYTDFEAVLYGSTKYYRDHVLHVIRVWLLGIYILTTNNFIGSIRIGEGEDVSTSEKFSLWTIIALTHDLGYPLEKSSQILSVTRNMMRHFVSNPVINMDFKFTGVQDTMNDFIIRLMSSKMTPLSNVSKGQYHNILQSKYYFKFLKSLEDNKHGVLSAIVIYKMLEYFLESDYNLSEDYVFKEEDKRQFYLRRDMLRAISSHTCESIYQNDILSFSFLLILCDECQEWGRRSFATMYYNNRFEYTLKNVDINRNDEDIYTCTIKESYSKIVDENIQDVSALFCDRITRQFLGYSKWFRDGQSIQNRNYIFRKEIATEHKNARHELVSVIEINKYGKPTYSLLAGGKEVTSTRNIDVFEAHYKKEFERSMQSTSPM